MVQERGEGNVLITPEKIADESLYRLMHHLVIAALSSRNFEKYFAEKIGDFITIKKPYQASVGYGREMTDADFASMIDKYVTLTVNKRARWGRATATPRKPSTSLRSATATCAPASRKWPTSTTSRAAMPWGWSCITPTDGRAPRSARNRLNSPTLTPVTLPFLTTK